MGAKRLHPAARAKLAMAQSILFKWTFETQTLTDGSFTGVVKDEMGKKVITLKQDKDFETFHMIQEQGYMKNPHDMKGLASWLWERNIVKMSKEDKESWNKKKKVPLEIKEIVIK